MSLAPTNEDRQAEAGQTPAAWATGSLALSMLLASLGVSIANVALPTLAQVFNASFQAIQWVVLSYLLAITVVIVTAGRLGDILGHRRVLLIGIGLFSVGALLCGLSPTLWMLILARAVQGLGAAILMALTVALVRKAVPAARTGSAMGLLGTTSAIGTALGPSLGGLLIAGPGWRAIFLILLPLGIINFLLVRRFLPADASSGKMDIRQFDVVGTVLLGLTLAACALATTLGDGQFSRLNLGLLAVALLGLGLFLVSQARLATPLIDLAAFRNPALNAGLAMNLLVSTVMMATLVIGPFYLSQALGLSPALIGLTMSVGPVVSALSGFPAGKLVDRFGARHVGLAGLAVMAAGTLALCVLPALVGLLGYILAITLLTPGYQLFQAANNTAVMMDVPAERRGVISGLLSLSRNLGLVTGASVAGAVFAAAISVFEVRLAQAQAVSMGFQLSFALGAVLILIALGLALASRAPASRP